MYIVNAGSFVITFPKICSVHVRVYAQHFKDDEAVRT